jgi:voltage-gated potassium channel
MTEHDTDRTPLLTRERREVLRALEHRLEAPMLVLSVVWTVLLVLELVRGLSPFLEWVGIVIWIAFAFEFALGFVLADDKASHLRREWATALTLLAPTLRLLRIARVVRVVRAARGLRLLNVFASVSQAMRTLGRSLSQRGFGYLAALSMLIILSGAAGMYAFEREAAADARGFDSYATAIWWTAMLLTTMGSDYWPRTTEGRTLCFILALYGFAMFGYVTAALSSYFVGRDAEDERAALAGKSSVQALQADIVALREEVRRLTDRISRASGFTGGQHDV